MYKILLKINFFFVTNLRIKNKKKTLNYGKYSIELGFLVVFLTHSFARTDAIFIVSLLVRQQLNVV